MPLKRHRNVKRRNNAFKRSNKAKQGVLTDFKRHTNAKKDVITPFKKRNNAFNCDKYDFGIVFLRYFALLRFFCNISPFLCIVLPSLALLRLSFFLFVYRIVICLT